MEVVEKLNNLELLKISEDEYAIKKTEKSIFGKTVKFLQLDVQSTYFWSNQIILNVHTADAKTAMRFWNCQKAKGESNG